MLVVLTFLIMLIVAYAHFREGLFTALATLINVLLAGVLTFNFWEPLADFLDPTFQGSPLAGFEDWLALVTLFCVALGLLRLLTNNIAHAVVEFHPVPQQIGAAAVGLLTGYLVAGFLVCTMETLPWPENFLDFSPRSTQESNLRRLFPPDRAWLALMRHASAYPLANTLKKEDAESAFERFKTFDRSGTFELRYQRYRRYGDNRPPLPYQKELEQELDRSP